MTGSQVSRNPQNGEAQSRELLEFFRRDELPVPPSTQPLDFSEDPRGGGRICGEPRAVAIHDEVLQLCYDVTVPCGGNAGQAAERYRRFLQTRNLSENVAARIHRAPAQTTTVVVPAETGPDAGDVVRGVLEFLLALTPLGWSGCSTAQPDVPIEIPDASAPPPEEDLAFAGRPTPLQDSDPLRAARTPGADGGASVASELQRQYPGLALPTLNVTFDGHEIWQDSAGNLIREIHTSDPVSFVRVDNRLYVLTANSLGSAYAPSTLLVYDVSSMPPRPVATDDIATDSRGGPSNAIVLGHYNPVAMATSVGNTEISVLFGNPTAGVVSTIDPFSNQIIESDWCSTQGVVTDGGMSGGGDASFTPDAGA